MRGNSVVWLGIAWLAIAGCGKKAETGATNSDQGIAVDPPQATFAWVEKHIISAKCLECHSGPKGKGGIQLDGGYEQVKKFVSAGDPDGSDIWNAVDTGGMPFKRTPLPASHKTALKKWIEGGAKNQ